jgi:Tfp pilus assembly protein PilV
MKPSIYIIMQHPSHSTDSRNRSTGNRRGMVLIILLVCLAVAVMLIAGAVKIALTSHKATQTASWSVQARWLAESAAERAAAKLVADPAYAGETWKIPAEEFGGQKDGSEGGTVRIEVKPLSGQEKRRTIKIEADFPDDPVHFARQQKEILVDLP